MGNYNNKYTDKIFNTLNKSESSTGIGLSIVKKIVEEHNGTIQIENIQPHGAHIAITLPTVSKDDSTIVHEVTWL